VGGKPNRCNRCNRCNPQPTATQPTHHTALLQGLIYAGVGLAAAVAILFALEKARIAKSVEALPPSPNNGSNNGSNADVGLVCLPRRNLAMMVVNGLLRPIYDTAPLVRQPPYSDQSDHSNCYLYRCSVLPLIRTPDLSPLISDLHPDPHPHHHVNHHPHYHPRHHPRHHSRPSS